MPRIEQMPNGSYVRRLNHLEEQIINRLYKEITDREAGDDALRIRIQASEEDISSINATIQAIRVHLNKMDEDHQILLPLIPHFTEIKALNEEQDARLLAIETLNTEQDGRLTVNETKNTEQDGRLDLIEAKNTEQDGRLSTQEQKNTTQDDRLDATEAVNVTQDGRLTNNEAKNVEQDGRLDAIEAKNTEQDGRLTANETKNTEQDTRLDGIDTKNTVQDDKIAELETTIANKSDIHLTGTSNFASTTGVTIAHAIGHTTYRVYVTPTENPNGFLGEVWVIKATNSFTVFCSGSSTVAFDYIALG